MRSRWIASIEVRFRQQNRNWKRQSRGYSTYQCSEPRVVRQEEIHIRQCHQVLLVHEVVAVHLPVFAPTIVGRQRLYSECREICQLRAIQESPLTVSVDNDASRGLRRE